MNTFRLLRSINFQQRVLPANINISMFLNEVIIRTNVFRESALIRFKIQSENKRKQVQNSPGIC